MLRLAAAASLMLALLCSACPAHSTESTRAPASLRLASSSPWVLRGPAGGPFEPARVALEIQAPASAVQWRAKATAEWLVLAETEGSLAIGGSKELVATLDMQRAGQLAPGVHSAQITIADAAAPDAPQRVFVLLDARSPEWTKFEPSNDTRIVYVSSSQGNDKNDGLTKLKPKKTLAAGKSLLRHGHPDWLLLRCGDTWDEAFGQWLASGRSAKEPLLVSSWGEGERPFLRTGSENALWTSDGGGSPKRIEHVAFVGLHMSAHTYAGGGEPAGISFLVGSTNVLVEDCLIEHYQTNIVMQGYFGRHTNFRLRRSVIVDAFATGNATSGHGLYISNTDGVLIEETLFDHNGWNESIPDAKPSIFRHDVYVQGGSGTCSDVVARGNVFANAASHGLQLRPGGVALDNLFARNSIALLLGGGNEPNPGGVIACAVGNVIVDAKDIDAENKRGWGIELSNVASGVVARNVIANRAGGRFPIPIDVHASTKGSGVFDCVLAENVISDWGGSLLVQGDERQLRAIVLERNVIWEPKSSSPLVSLPRGLSEGTIVSRSNRFQSDKAPASAWFSAGDGGKTLDDWRKLTSDRDSTTGKPAFPAPERTLASYNASLGGAATLDAFLAEARKQSKARWREELTAHAANAWIRAGFELAR